MLTQKQTNYDYSFVSPLPKHLECPICLLVLRDPHVISCCGNHFCHTCIHRILADAKPCPLCQTGDFNVMLHKGVMREVNALEVKCPNERAGCLWKGELGKVDSHVNSSGPLRGGDRGCEYALVRCIYLCGYHFQRRFIQNHQTEECEKRPVDIQLRSLSRKMERVIKENEELNVEVAEFKRKLNVVGAENKTLKERTSKLEHNERQKSGKNPGKLTPEVEALKREMSEVRSSYTTQSNSSNLELQAIKQELERQKKTIAELKKTIPIRVPRQVAPKSYDPLNVVMVEDLKEASVIHTQRVEEAMKSIDRKNYAPVNHYVDSPQSIGHNTTISAPHMHAHTLELLNDLLRDGTAVLDVGTGSGYLTACMAYMCSPSGYVVGIDCVSDLTQQATKNIMKDNPELLRYNVFMVTGDGHLGYSPKAPYDVIHVGAATMQVPQALYDQLKVGGRLIVPVMYPLEGKQYLEQHDKGRNDDIVKKRIMAVQYGPLFKM